MKEDNVLKDKSLAFGIRISKLANHLVKTYSYAHQVLCSQILRSGTSIGANVREGEYAESKEDMRHKFKIALKEANETEYWIELLHESGMLNAAEYNSIIFDCKELIKLLTASVNTLNKQ